MGPQTFCVAVPDNRKGRGGRLWLVGIDVLAIAAHLHREKLEFAGRNK